MKHGADINKETNEGYILLFYSCMNGHKFVVKHLMEQI